MARTKDIFDVETEERPWGKFHEYRKGLKILEVFPNESISLQFHKYREEFWEILEGNPIITIGENIVQAKVGDRFIVPAMNLHRINGGNTGTRILEIAMGEFDENDIVRIEDKYNRTSPDDNL